MQLASSFTTDPDWTTLIQSTGENTLQYTMATLHSRLWFLWEWVTWKWYRLPSIGNRVWLSLHATVLLFMLSTCSVLGHAYGSMGVGWQQGQENILSNFPCTILPCRLALSLLCASLSFPIPAYLLLQSGELIAVYGTTKCMVIRMTALRQWFSKNWICETSSKPHSSACFSVTPFPITYLGLLPAEMAHSQMVKHTHYHHPC